MNSTPENCEKCNGNGRIRIVPEKSVKPLLRAEIERTCKGKEREALLKSLEGLPTICPDCKGTGRKA